MAELSAGIKNEEEQRKMKQEKQKSMAAWLFGLCGNAQGILYRQRADCSSGSFLRYDTLFSHGGYDIKAACQR